MVLTFYLTADKRKFSHRCCFRPKSPSTPPFPPNACSYETKAEVAQVLSRDQKPCCASQIYLNP